MFLHIRLRAIAHRSDLPRTRAMKFSLERRQPAFTILGIGRVPACTGGLRDEACGGGRPPIRCQAIVSCPLLRQGLGWGLKTIHCLVGQRHHLQSYVGDPGDASPKFADCDLFQVQSPSKQASIDQIPPTCLSGICGREPARIRENAHPHVHHQVQTWSCNAGCHRLMGENGPGPHRPWTRAKG
jgi:hypothetical protein